MTLFIAEKPELARAIADGLSGELKERQRSHIIKGENIITHAFGHILELAKPESYNKAYEKWNLSDLPLKLARPLKRVAKVESKTQLNLIINFINDARVKEIVHCGDADEEGQILIDEILAYAKNTKPVFRALINDITPKAIAKAINEKRANEEFSNLSQSGFARSEADFLVGLNFTRLYTLLNQKNGGSGMVSVGRVQTPILGLIVHRELDYKNHKALHYFALSGSFDLNDILINASLKLEKDEKIVQENKALEIKNACENKEFKANITKENKKEYPPLPFNLLELQAELSRLYGFSPDKSLKLTQSLRENHKAISYNRSDCQYLPESLYEEAPELIETLKANFTEDIGQNNANLSIKSKAFDDAKLSAHYGIVPLQTKLELDKLSEDEKKVYTLITKRFLMQFYEPCEYENFTFTFSLDDYVFQTSKRVDTKLGFKSFFEDKKEDKNEDYDVLLRLNSAFCKSIESKKEQTKPKPLYTMTTLLKDLNQVSKYVKDERIKKLLIEKDKDKKGESGGIGTPATRSNHIKTLIDREYIEVSKDKKQNIKATAKGIALIQNLPSLLTQPDMTALWYEKQKEILSGNLSKEDFLKEIDSFILKIIDENKGVAMSFNEKDENLTSCPKCKEGKLRELEGKFGKFFACLNYKNGCDFKAKSKNGKPDLSPQKEIEKSEYECPQCQKGFLIRRESKNKKGSFWYGCSEFKNGCKFICFEKEGKPILEDKVG
ncbi:DNA topoisomerase [Campylobacter upsaliensis]|uniref:DNA topoisomerase n=1 Tax=Campylobacter upsaliensis TaxID=28080 RepID=UPI002149E4A6|nr:DNA topoisomerase [Campylobacter upsaliensis]MCR2112195.1 DNA topoisomerase [Campylobacter upsaliensis]